MNARRLELYELLKPKLDEAPARALVLALPDDPDQLVTKDDLKVQLEGLESRLDARFARMETVLTRRMVSIMGAWTILIGSAFAWAALLLRP